MCGLPLPSTNIILPKGLTSKLEGYKWEYNQVDSKEVNAWCMPGGKIVVYTGLLPISQNEAALAVVLGHEIAHALAQHGNERMSQATVQQLGGVALQTTGVFTILFSNNRTRPAECA